MKVQVTIFAPNRQTGEPCKAVFTEVAPTLFEALLRLAKRMAYAYRFKAPADEPWNDLMGGFMEVKDV